MLGSPSRMKMCRLCAFDRNDDEMERCRQCGADLAPVEDDEPDTDTAWFHYLQVPSVGTIELVPGRAFKIGREARNELVIPKASQDVLATLFWTDDYDEATIREEGAPEGVKIDSIKLTGTRTLKGGEEVQVGAMRMTYLRRATRIANAIDVRRRPPTPGPSRSFAQVALPHQRTPTRPAPAPARRSAVGAAPSDVLLALEKTKSSGTLRVTSDSGRGYVTLVSGNPRHAAFGGVAGRDALLAILGLARGRCSMTPGVPARGPGQKIDVTVSQALASLRKPAPPPRPATPPRPAPPPAARPKGPPPPPQAGPPRRPMR